MHDRSIAAPMSGHRQFWIFNGVVSVCAAAFLAWLTWLRPGEGRDPQALAFMPAVNAGFNALAASWLIAGRLAIRRGREVWHRRFMTAALLTSVLFLVGYVTYHSVHGDTKFGGQGAIRLLYFLLLASHILCSLTIVPGALAAVYFAYQRDFATHVRVTRTLWPIWVYVSCTGVAIFAFLRAYA